MSDLTTLTNLSDLQLAIVKGEDASNFLQGQLSNDISLLDTNPHQLSAYCTPKGRMLAIFNVLKLDEGYGLIAPVDILAKVLSRLKMFVMRSKVEIDLSLQSSLFGISLNQENTPSLNHYLTQQNIKPFALYNDKNRAFIVATQDQVKALTENLTDSIELAGFEQWRALDIKNGLPQLFIENHEALIPQSVNLDIVEGVNFKKGCYPGQEIIARVKYRGKPKTRMIAGKVVLNNALMIGAPIYIDNKNSPAGLIINIAQDSKHILLNISAPVTHITSGNIYLNEQKDLLFNRLEMPYEIAV